jgi:hypothetical protein
MLVDGGARVAEQLFASAQTDLTAFFMVCNLGARRQGTSTPRASGLHRRI